MGEPLVIASARCPEPEDGLRTAEPRTKPSRADGAPAPLVRLAERPAETTADRSYRVLVNEDLGCRNATQFVGSIPPGRAPDHFHHYEEVLVVLCGEGRMWSGGTHTPIRRASCIFLPRGQVHCLENTGADELRVLGVFHPSGSPAAAHETD